MQKSHRGQNPKKGPTRPKLREKKELCNKNNLRIWPFLMPLPGFNRLLEPLYPEGLSTGLFTREGKKKGPLEEGFKEATRRLPRMANLARNPI